MNGTPNYTVRVTIEIVDLDNNVVDTKGRNNPLPNKAWRTEQRLTGHEDFDAAAREGNRLFAVIQGIRKLIDQDHGYP